jgi:hypothetical protein
MYSLPTPSTKVVPEDVPLSAERPLRCVLYNEHPVGQTKFDDWLQSMLDEYELRDCREYLVNPGVVMRNAGYEDRYVVYEFVPRAPVEPRLTSRAPTILDRLPRRQPRGGCRLICERVLHRCD